MYKKAEQTVPSAFGNALFTHRDTFGDRRNNVKYLSQVYGTRFPDYQALGMNHVGSSKADKNKLIQAAGAAILPVRPAITDNRDQTFSNMVQMRMLVRYPKVYVDIHLARLNLWEHLIEQLVLEVDH